MVNPGHMSKGCMTCRLRKVQCDFTRPLCWNCTKSGRLCLGYEDVPATDREAISFRSLKPSEGYDKRKMIEASRAAVSFLQKLFMGACERIPQCSGSLCSSHVDMEAIHRGSHDVAASVLETIRKCFASLRQPQLCYPARTALLAEYGKATSELRATLELSSRTPALAACAAFLFSVYEMIVNIDPEDMTWRIHLEGLLDIFSQQAMYYDDLPLEDFDGLRYAITISKSEDDVFQELGMYNVSCGAKAFLLLDITTLRLRSLVSQIEKLVRSETPRRQLDVKKLRASIKHLQKNLELFPKICSKFGLSPINITLNETTARILALARWNHFYSLQLIVNDLLISLGKLIHSINVFEGMTEYSILSTNTQEAAKSICSTVSILLKTMNTHATVHAGEEGTLFIQGFLVLWPLCCALKSPGVTQSERMWINDTLWWVGTNACIPHASALASSKAENTSWTDVVAGLLLMRIALSKEMRGLFQQYDDSRIRRPNIKDL